AGSLYLRRFAGVGSSRVTRQAGGGLPGESKFKRVRLTKRGGSQAIPYRRTPPEPGAALSTTRSGPTRGFPRAGKSPYVFAATGSGSPHHHGEDRRIPPPGQLVAAAPG